MQRSGMLDAALVVIKNRFTAMLITELKSNLVLIPLRE